MKIHDWCEYVGGPVPMFGFVVSRCDTCGCYAAGIQTEWVMTFAGRGWGSYYGPEPAEYDEFAECPACQQDRRANEAAEEAYYDALAAANEVAEEAYHDAQGACVND